MREASLIASTDRRGYSPAGAKSGFGTVACTVRTAPPLRHRDDGPAAVYPDGHKVWFIEGVKVREER